MNYILLTLVILIASLWGSFHYLKAFFQGNGGTIDYNSLVPIRIISKKEANKVTSYPVSRFLLIATIASNLFVSLASVTILIKLVGSK